MMKKEPQRMCLNCRQFFDKKDLIRVVKLQDKFEIDETFKKNGRGAYICPDPECLKKAKKSKGLERSLKISIPEEIYASLEKEMSTLEK